MFDQSRNFANWLFSIARNLCRNEYRRTNIRKETLIGEDMDFYDTKIDLFNIEEEISEKQMEEVIKNMLAELRTMAAAWDSGAGAGAEGSSSSSASASAASSDRQVMLLEQMLKRLDNLEQQVTMTAQRQEQLSSAQARRAADVSASTTPFSRAACRSASSRLRNEAMSVRRAIIGARPAPPHVDCLARIAHA